MADFWQSLVKLVASFLVNKAEGKTEVEVTIPIGMETPEQLKQEIDWTNPDCKISKYFTVKEALWLPSWQVIHIPSEQEKTNILKHVIKMDLIREFVDAPVRVHCWIRPILNNPSSLHHGQDYNALVKGAKNSAHKIGLATDYDVIGFNCDEIRSKLEPKLEEWDLRMEKAPGTNWVHNDSALVITYRYFYP